MPLKKSISGFRGTIGGKAGDNLTPEDIVANVAGYGTWLIESGAKPLIVIGRDGRPSGPIVKSLTVATLQSLGIDVIDCDFATTPTIQMAVIRHEAGGGIVFSASHNPREYNALKLLDHQGEFISASAVARLMEIAEKGEVVYSSIDQIGQVTRNETALDHHIEKILAHPLVAVDQIRAANLNIVVDAINSVGAISVPPLCKALGVKYTVINGEMDGMFNHNPEPLPAHLGDLMTKVKQLNADLGIAVDPDVDRLALVGPGGKWIGEEYTLAVVADYYLSRQPGPVVSNVSSSRVVRDIAKSYGQDYYASAVGEFNVVSEMKMVGAVIGGEGSGGIIDPALHHGRDALIGIALVLSHIATSGESINNLREGYPDYQMVKQKFEVDKSFNLEAALDRVQNAFHEIPANTADGLRLDFPDGWVHLRASNTEPIVRIYAEAHTEEMAQELAARVRNEAF